VAAAAGMIGDGAYVEAVLVFTVGAALVVYGEMALIVRQQIKLNGKKLIPPLVASLMGSRHAMCGDVECTEGVEGYRRRFKNFEKHFIMTTPEIDTIKYVKENLRDEARVSKLHEAEAVCAAAEKRMDTYYRMFHLYRRKCLQFGCLELFLAIMIVPIWGIGIALAGYVGSEWMDHMVSIVLTGVNLVMLIPAVVRHITVWRFKELYFKIYQALSVLMVDGDLRENPDELQKSFAEIEESAIRAIAGNREMRPMWETLKRVSSNTG